MNARVDAHVLDSSFRLRSSMKGSVCVISSDLLFQERHSIFTTVPFKPWTDNLMNAK